MEFFKVLSSILLISFAAADSVPLGAGYHGGAGLSGSHGGGLNVGIGGPVVSAHDGGGLYRGDVEVHGHDGVAGHGGHVHGLFPYEYVTGIQTARLVKSDLYLPGPYQDGIPHVVGGNIGGHGGHVHGGHHGGAIISGGGHHGGDVVLGGGHRSGGVILGDGGFGGHAGVGGGLSHGVDLFASGGHINSISGGHGVHQGDLLPKGEHVGGILGGEKFLGGSHVNVGGNLGHSGIGYV